MENVYHKPCFQSDVLTLYMHQLREEGDMLSGGRYRVGCHEERDGACGHEWIIKLKLIQKTQNAQHNLLFFQYLIF